MFYADVAVAVSYLIRIMFYADDLVALMYLI